MPAANLGRHYGASLAAGGASQRLEPANGRRVLLIIQNTGANPALVRFGTDVTGNGEDFSIAALDFLGYTIPSNCPKGSINALSVLGTTLSIQVENLPS